jgi:hypothetical protein
VGTSTTPRLSVSFLVRAICLLLSGDDRKVPLPAN